MDCSFPSENYVVFRDHISLLPFSLTDDSSSYLIQDSYNDETNFMQNLFGSNNLNASSFSENNKGKAPLDIEIDRKNKCSTTFNPFGYSSFSGNNQCFGGNRDYGLFPLPTKSYLGGLMKIISQLVCTWTSISLIY